MTSSSPGDIDVAYRGEWREEDEALVRAWTAERGLRSSLTIDAHRDCGRGDWVLHLPRVREDESPPFVMLRGTCTVQYVTHYALPSRIRAARSAEELAAVLDAPNLLQNRLALCERAEGVDYLGEWADYTQGITALRNAIAKCAAWTPTIAACAKIERLLVRGLAPASKKKLRGGASAGSPNVNCIVTSRGIEPIHGDFVIAYPHPWARKRPLSVAR